MNRPRFHASIAACALCAWASLFATYAAAQPQPRRASDEAQANEESETRTRRRLEELRATWNREPSANDVAQAALRHFRVHPEALDDLRANARLRALAPVISGSYRRYGSTSDSLERREMTDPSTTTSVGNLYDDSFSVGVSWDTREAVFNGDQVQVYGLVGVQRDLMLEVLRAYFARRQLMLTMQLRPPSDPLALGMLMLRVDEFTAVIDLLTGGWFSRTVGESRDRARPNAE